MHGCLSLCPAGAWRGVRVMLARSLAPRFLPVYLTCESMRAPQAPSSLGSGQNAPLAAAPPAPVPAPAQAPSSFGTGQVPAVTGQPASALPEPATALAPPAPAASGQARVAQQQEAEPTRIYSSEDGDRTRKAAAAAAGGAGTTAEVSPGTEEELILAEILKSQ